MVDAIGLGPINRKVVGVQIPSSAPENMKSTIVKEQDGTIKLTIPLSWESVQKTREEVIDQTVKNTTLPGFRKGMAPRKMVEDTVDKFKLQEEILRHLLPEAYSEAVKEHQLQPIMNPKIQINKIEEGKDWEFTAETCETPAVKLGDYKAEVKKVTAKSKIIVPGKNDKEEQKGPNMDDIIKVLLDNATVTIPAILLDAEVDRQLSQMLDEVKSLGLSLDQYLASTHKTIDQIKEDYRKRAEQDVKFEFVLQKVSDDEKISIDQKELQEALDRAQSPEERKNLEANIYLLASILRQQKTLDFLRNL